MLLEAFLDILGLANIEAARGFRLKDVDIVFFVFHGVYKKKPGRL